MKYLGCSLACSICSGILLVSRITAHDIITTNLTYTRDISRILARRCISCHSSNASIPLTRYEEVRPWAVDIKDQVLSRAMPRWGAVKGFGDLAIDNALSQEEILIISAWVVGGAPKGDPALAPKDEHPVETIINPECKHLQTVSTRTIIDAPITLIGLRPQVSVASARLTARLPNGHIQPLVWLYNFDAKSDQVFRFRDPLFLPAGTIIESSAPLRFVLEGPPTKSSHGA